jgi:hypothetical protein
MIVAEGDFTPDTRWRSSTVPTKGGNYENDIKETLAFLTLRRYISASSSTDIDYVGANSTGFVKMPSRDRPSVDVTIPVEREVAAVLGDETAEPVLRIFLCHASEDKEAVRALYRKLLQPGFAPWLDEEKLLPGQDWDAEITKAIRASHVVLVCLSQRSEKRGYVQKEIVRALDVADEQPEGTIFLIPVRLEDCHVPERLRRWQWVNLFHDHGFERLQASLRTVLPAQAIAEMKAEARAAGLTDADIDAELAVYNAERRDGDAVD